LQVKAPSALALPKVYHAEIARSDLDLLCVYVCWKCKLLSEIFFSKIHCSREIWGHHWKWDILYI